MLKQNYRMDYEVVKDWWFDTKSDDILTVNAKILDERAREEIEGKVEKL